MAYQLVILGFDENNRLPTTLLTTGGPDNPVTIHVECNPCVKTKRVIVSPTYIPPSGPDKGYQEGPNPVATDTKELYVFEFADAAAGDKWMLAQRNVLVGKTIYSIDDTLG